MRINIKIVKFVILSLLQITSSFNRAIMTHASVPPEAREVLGIKDTLIRLSIGLEEVDDLIEDIQQALELAVSLAVFERFLVFEYFFLKDIWYLLYSVESGVL